MSRLRTVETVFEVAVILFVVAMIAGQVLGQPVLLGFVETGSMQPTLRPGDGFVAVPSAVAGDIETGDVVTFRATEIQGGGLTTHRVVAETDRGFVTKGDGNPFTDQDSGEPPVKRAQVVATALRVDGQVVVVPHLGTGIEEIRSVLTTVQRRLSTLLGTSAFLGIRGLAYLGFAVSLLWYAAGEWRNRGTRRRRRRRDTDRATGIDGRLVFGAFAVLLVCGATAAMIGPAGTQEYGVVSAEFDSDRPTVIPAGESGELAYPVGNGGFVPVFVHLEPASDGVGVRPSETRVRSGAVVNATVTLHAPAETGYYRRFVVEHRYLAVLPRSVIRTLHQFHPWAPVVVIDALVGVPFYLVGTALSGSGRLRTRSRDRGLSILGRLRRRFRSLY